MLDKVPRTRRKAVAASLKAIHAQQSRAKYLAKAREVASELRESKLESTAEVIERGAKETLSYVLFPPEHLKEDTHQQRHRVAEPADQEAHRRRGQLPGGRRCGEAGGSEVQVRGRGRLGLPALP